jgi:putative FmdB family regulatory protein
MPLYEYECTVCRRHTEKIQKFSDPEITTCPHCGGELKRVISAPAIAFKGGGWYADGYASAKPSGETKSSEGAASDTGTPAPASAPAAPAASSTSATSAPAKP